MKKFIGDKAFYKMVLLVAVPIMVQNGITNFVNLLDNIMVGQVGTNQMSGVAIVNQLITVFNLCIFGGVSGVGIFTAQYYGSGDEEGVRHTLRLKLMVVAVLVGIWFLVFGIFGDDLIRMFLKGDAQGNDAALTFEYAREYLHIMMGCLIPFALTQTYSGTLRETGRNDCPNESGNRCIFCKSAVRLQFDLWKIRISGTWGTRSSDSNRDRTNRRSGGCHGVGAQSYGRKTVYTRCVPFFPCADGFSKGSYQKRNPAAVKRDVMGRRNGNAGTLLFLEGTGGGCRD